MHPLEKSPPPSDGKELKLGKRATKIPFTQNPIEQTISNKNWASLFDDASEFITYHRNISNSCQVRWIPCHKGLRLKYIHQKWLPVRNQINVYSCGRLLRTIYKVMYSVLGNKYIHYILFYHGTAAICFTILHIALFLCDSLSLTWHHPSSLVLLRHAMYVKKSEWVMSGLHVADTGREN